MNGNLSSPGSKVIECRRLTGGEFAAGEVSVVAEKELPVYVNGRHLATASIVPGMEREFVTGYLYGQGFVNRVEEISSIDVNDEAARVRLISSAGFSVSPGKTGYRIVSGGGRTAYSIDAGLRRVKSGMKVRKDTVFLVMNTLFEKAEMYRETEGVHAAGLFNTRGEPVCIVEDIGRHNTIDKLVGYGLINGVDFTGVLLASTGRMASEMVTKICRAGIPIAATKTAVTDKGLEIAVKCGLTLIGFVRDAGTEINTDMEVRVIREAGMKIYCGAKRVLCE